MSQPDTLAADPFPHPSRDDAAFSFAESLPGENLTLKSIRDILAAIASRLDAETEFLFEIFLKFDLQLCGHIRHGEAHSMLRELDSDLTEEQRASYIEALIPDQTRGLLFLDFVNWWRRKEAEDPPGVALRALLTSKLLLHQAKRYMWNLFTKTAIEDRLERAPQRTLLTTLDAYSEILVSLCASQEQAKRAAAAQLERKQHREAFKTTWTTEELERLRVLYDGTATRGVLSTESLPQLALCLGYDMPTSVMETTREALGPLISFEDFKAWWACRPESGKMKPFYFF